MISTNKIVSKSLPVLTIKQKKDKSQWSME